VAIQRLTPPPIFAITKKEKNRDKTVTATSFDSIVELLKPIRKIRIKE
jgi:hypothetical protein